MPIYEYECGKCRVRFEKKQGFDEEAKAMCPQCQGKAKRVLFSTPVIFKGSGFYVTENRKGSDSSAAPSKPSTAPSSAAKKS